MNHLLPIAQSLGWTIVHSLWQIALIWLVFNLFAWRLQRHNNTIYLFSLAAMSGAVVWSVCTFAEAYRRLALPAPGLTLALPETPAADPVFAGPASWRGHLLLYLMLALSPVTLFNLAAIGGLSLNS